MTYAPDDLVAIQHYLHIQTQQPWDALGIIHGSPQGGGYHEGRDLLHAAGCAPEDPGSDYSYVESERDRAGLTNAGSAMDIGGDFDRFRQITMSIVRACEGNDPRTRDVREVIYTSDGLTVRRFDRLGRRSSGDSSHRSHTHVSFFRDSEGRRDRNDNFLGLLTELFEGDDMDSTQNAMLTNADALAWGAYTLTDVKVYPGDNPGLKPTPQANALKAKLEEILAAVKKPPAATVSLSDAQIQQIAAQVTDAHEALTGADAPVIEAAMRNVLRGL